MNKQESIKRAKTCFGHIGGKFGIILMENFADKGWIAKEKATDKHFYITELGQKELTKFGLDLSQIK